MVPAMFVPWHGDWTSEKTGIHPPFKCSHTRTLFTLTTKQPVPKYAISLARFGNLALKVLGWETSLRDSYCLYETAPHTYTHNPSPCYLLKKYEGSIITRNYLSSVINFFQPGERMICIKTARIVAQIFINGLCWL